MINHKVVKQSTTRCSECGREVVYVWDADTSNRLILKIMRSEGWSFGAKRCRCPVCNPRTWMEIV